MKPSRRLFLNGVLLAAAALPLGAQPKWKLVEDLRVGGAETGPASFNDVRDLAVDASGRIFTLDWQTQEIRSFDATGKFLRLIGRKGAGPGEYSQPNGLLVGPDGSLWVNDVNNHRYVVFSGDGIFLKQHLVPVWGFGFRWNAVMDAQGRVLERIYVRGVRANEGSSPVQRFDPARNGFDTLTAPGCFPPAADPGQWTWRAPRGGATVPFAPTDVFLLDTAGARWCGAGASYHIKLVRLGTGETLADWKSAAPAALVSAAERDSAIAGVEKWAAKTGATNLDYSKIPKTHPRFDGLDVDDKGRLWARRRTPTGLAFDVWSRSGVQVATLESPVRFERYMPLVVRNERLYGVVRDNDGIPFIVRFRVVR